MTLATTVHWTAEGRTHTGRVEMVNQTAGWVLVRLASGHSVRVQLTEVEE